MIKITTNPNKEFAEDIRNKIKENDGYCVCAIVHDDDYKCMCKEFRDQIERGESGSCGCGLYIATITED